MADEPNQPTEPTPGSADPSGGQNDADAPLNQAGGGGDAAPSSPEASAAADGGFSEVSQDDIDALFGKPVGGGAAGETSTDSAARQAGDPPTAETPAGAAEEPQLDSMGRPFDDAAAAMAAAMAEEGPLAAASPSATATATATIPQTRAPSLEEFTLPPNIDIDPKRVTMLSDVNLRVKIELGRTRMLVEDVLKLGEGSVVELDKLAGDPVDVYVNNRLIARGEVLVLNDSFCVRISELITEDPHRVTT